MQDIKGRTALVTGASSGIGLATVEALAQRGAHVALNHLTDDNRGSQEVARLRAAGFDIIAAPGSVAEPEACERMVKGAIDTLGGLDILINNAGTPATSEPIVLSDFERMSEEFWATILATNLVGPFRCTKFAAVALRVAKGAVVNTASIGGLDVPGSSIAYSASKAGLINMTKNLARALSPEVRVNAVAPGYVESPWTSEWPQTKKDAFVQKTLLRRACQPQDVAEVIVFLAADAAMVTGQTLVVDGGLTLA